MQYERMKFLCGRYQDEESELSLSLPKRVTSLTVPVVLRDSLDKRERREVNNRFNLELYGLGCKHHNLTGDLDRDGLLSVGIGCKDEMNDTERQLERWINRRRERGTPCPSATLISPMWIWRHPW